MSDAKLKGRSPGSRRAPGSTTDRGCRCTRAGGDGFVRAEEMPNRIPLGSAMRGSLARGRIIHQTRHLNGVEAQHIQGATGTCPPSYFQLPSKLPAPRYELMTGITAGPQSR